MPKLNTITIAGYGISPVGTSKQPISLFPSLLNLMLLRSVIASILDGAWGRFKGSLEVAANNTRMINNEE
ncbi:MAG: hypothetical protein MUO67_23880 [Anaerolineales bacterium]|nr:hypothetical protein [Anaerolineales bacterium]